MAAGSVLRLRQQWNDIFRLMGVDDIVLTEDGPMIPAVFGNKESGDGQTETA